MKVAIVGGGASAHLLAVLLSGRGHCVTIVTSRPKEWADELELEVEADVLRGRIHGVTSDCAAAIANSEVAFMCMPVHKYPVALSNIVKGLKYNSKCIIGTVYGQGGFDWMITDVCRKQGISSIRYFAIGLLPWIARTVTYGKRSISYGPKLRNGIATCDIATYEYLQANILDDLSQSYWGCGKFERVPNFLTLTLTVDNQIIHPSRCYGLASQHYPWKSINEVPFFYKDFDDYSTDILRGIDADYTCVRTAYAKRFPHFDSKYNLSYLELEHWSYGSHNPDIKASFVNSHTLREIKPPITKFCDSSIRLDVNNRFFKDDFAFGLEIAQWFARHLDCKVPHIDALLNWYAKEIRPHQDAVMPSATPDVYGVADSILSGEMI